jgi:hypothetical protein
MVPAKVDQPEQEHENGQEQEQEEQVWFWRQASLRSHERLAPPLMEVHIRRWHITAEMILGPSMISGMHEQKKIEHAPAL